jgi:hypothetical protein
MKSLSVLSEMFAILIRENIEYSETEDFCESVKTIREEMLSVGISNNSWFFYAGIWLKSKPGSHPD